MNDRRGGTLVTVIAAVAILAITLTAATSAFFSASKLTRHSGFSTTAGNYAEGVMERTLAQPFASIRSADIASRLPNLPQAKCALSVTQPQAGLKEITVTCSWLEGDKPYSVRFSTLTAGGNRR